MPRPLGRTNHTPKYLVEWEYVDRCKGTDKYPSILEISKRFGIDRTTIYRHIKNDNYRYGGNLIMNITPLNSCF
jgi:DNA invertase Pin-like site-specific DNA recombinase